MTQTKGYFVRLTVTLLVISAVVAGLLGLTNHVTADKIAVLNQEKTAASMEQVLPADSYTPWTTPAVRPRWRRCIRRETRAMWWRSPPQASAAPLTWWWG